MQSYYIDGILSHRVTCRAPVCTIKFKLTQSHKVTTTTFFFSCDGPEQKWTCFKFNQPFNGHLTPPLYMVGEGIHHLAPTASEREEHALAETKRFPSTHMIN
jgi:hypothetical protein